MSKSDEINRPKLLVVEDDADLREALVETLTIEKMDVTNASSAEQAIEILAQARDFDLIVSFILGLILMLILSLVLNSILILIPSLTLALILLINLHYNKPSIWMSALFLIVHMDLST